MSANRITTRSLWEISGGNTRLKTADDVDFQKLKAIAMACDNGTTLPTTPATGQWFLHTPTGRSILMMYNGTSWTPIISLGAMTVYVSTTGTDSQNNGGATGASAFLTIQFAVNQIPGLVGGNVTINVGTGTFAETVTINGKSLTGDYTITIGGTLSELDSLTAAASVQGTGATQGTVVRNAGTWTAGTRQHKLVTFTSGANNGTYRAIDSHTTTTLTIASTWDSAVGVGDTFKVYGWGTIVAGNFVINGGQKGVYVNDINFNAFSSATTLTQWSVATFSRCLWDSPTAQVCFICQAFASGTLDTCILIQDENQRAITSQTNAYTLILRTKIVQSAAVTGTGIFINLLGSINIAYGSIVDNFTTGISTASNAVAQTTNSVALGYVRIQNCTTGITAATGAQVAGTGSVSYTANGTNESATAASYGYID